MNILILAPFLPYPLDQGGKIRIFNIIKHLSLTHAVTLAAVVDDRNASDLGALRQICEEIVLVERPARLWPDRLAFFTGRAPYNVIRYRSASMRRELRRLQQCGNFDMVQIEFSMMWQYAGVFNGTPVVLDAHNIEHRNVRQIGSACLSPFWRGLYLLEERRLRAVEERAWRECRFCLAVSDTERDEIASVTGNPASVATAPNGVDTERFAFRPRPEDGRSILFLGGMDYAPNLDAARWFLKDIFPLILQREPEARLLMVGRELWRLGECPAAVEYHENVPEVLPWFYRANILAVPLRQGAGTRIKVLEAFAAGLPVVSTAKGCEGIEALDGEHLLIADAPEDFAEAASKLMANPEMGQRLSAGARRLAEERYSWPKTAVTMEEKYRQAGIGRGREAE